MLNIAASKGQIYSIDIRHMLRIYLHFPGKVVTWPVPTQTASTLNTPSCYWINHRQSRRTSFFWINIVCGLMCSLKTNFKYIS